VAIAAMLVAASASAANRFAEVGGNGSEPCLVSDPCAIETAINAASSVTSDDVKLLGGLQPAPYTTSTALAVPSNVTVHGTIGARSVIQTNAGSGPGIKLSSGSGLRDVVVDYSGANDAAILLQGGGTLERVTGRSTGSTSEGGCGTLDGGTPVIRDSVCWHDGPFTTNPVGGVTARNGTAVAQTLTLRNVTAISSDNNDEAGIFAIRSGGGALTVNATNVIAFSENGSDVADFMGLPPTAVNLDHSNYASESDPGNVITNPGTGSPNLNQTTPPVFVDRLGGDFHQEPTSAGTIDLGTTSGQLMGELDFEGQERAIGEPDIGADELGHQTSTSIACAPASVTLGAGSTACTATVSDTVGALLPTGDVSFGSSGTGDFSGGGACTLAFVSDPVGSCQLNYTPAAIGSGSHEITGSYPGDAAHEGSQGSAAVGVAAPGGAGPITGPSPPSFNLAAAIKKCKKKFPKGKKRKKCIKRAKKRAQV
jgi:hypothetical protein